MEYLTIQGQAQTNQIIKKIIVLFLVISIFISHSNILLRTAVLSIAADGTEQAETEIAINQAITKYIPYSYSDEDYGIILQQSLSVTVAEATEMPESKYTIAIPKYSEIAPETIEITTKTAPLTQDNTQKAYYNIENSTLTITQKEQINQEYYITYYYGVEAYKKYLESTHVTEYNEGEIVDIVKDEETGEVWVYIDYNPEEPEEGTESDQPAQENKVLMDKTPIQINTKFEITNEKETTTTEATLSQELDIAISSEITKEMTSSIKEFSKSKLYLQQPIDFEISKSINITKCDKYSSFKIEEIGTYFITKEDAINTAKIKYNTLTINKDNFINILGDQGAINLINTNSEVIGTINAQTEADENGNYVFTYPENTEKITLEVTGIKNNGFLNIIQSQTLLADQGYVKAQLANFKTMNTVEKLIITDAEGNPLSNEQNVEIVLLETYSTADISVNNNNLSTIDTNSSIEFKLELKNNNENSDFWDSPLFIIEMPEAVEEIKINGSKIAYIEGMTINSTSVIEVNGHKAIKIQAVGTQTEYIASTIVGGTTIVVNTDIKLKELTPSSENNEIKMYYSNMAKTNYKESTELQLDEKMEMGYNTVKVNYIAPIEFKTIQKMSGFNAENTIISSENGEKEAGKLSILEPEKEVKQLITLMNNTGNETTQIKTIGRIPFVDNTDILTADNLQTTVNTTLSSLITYTGNLEKEIKIYYTENGLADTNLENTENGWIEAPENLANIKSFMIVISSISQGEKLNFEYNIKVPANLEHNENMYNSMATYYTNNTEVGAIEEISKVNSIGLTTGVGARAQIELSAGIDTGTVFTEGQKVKYTLRVTNTGELPAQNVVVLNQIPEGTTYVEETVVKNEIETFNKYTYYSSQNQIQWEIGTIEANQTAELQYTLIIDSIPSILEYYGGQPGFTKEDDVYYLITKEENGEEVKTELTDIPSITIVNKAILQCSNIEKELISNELQNEVKKSYFDILEESSIEKPVYISEGQDFVYSVIVENKRDIQLENIEISKLIPDGVTYKSAEVTQGTGTVNFNKEQNKLIATVEKMEAYGVIEVDITVTANKLPDGVYKKEVITNTEIKAGDLETNTSSSVTNTIGKPKMITSIECAEKQRYVYEGSTLDYTITVTNENDVPTAALNITNIIPKHTRFVSGSYTKAGNKYTIISDGTENVVLATNITNETITMKVTVQVEQINSAEEEIEIINKAIIKANNIEEHTIGEIKHTVINQNESGSGNEGEGNGNGSTGGETGDDGITRYKVKGAVWQDNNKDGQRQDNEETIRGITVHLINEKGDIVKDYKSNEPKTATTNAYGEYQFTNIEKGKYMVVFMYDDEIYSITEYQKSGVVSDRNSDAIQKNIIIAGKEQKAGVTDLIEVKDRNLYSIDLGLKQKEKFNMMLEAGISSITVKSKEGTKQQAYDMTNLAKVEIHSKHINGATVIIEYNLKITNNGELAGSVSQIVTNKVKDLTFTSSANQDWYEGNDGKLYLTGLTNIILQPGESTNAKLVLVKQMTSNNTGTIENEFTIAKTYNNNGQEETTLEDNTKKVSCIITVSTGKVVAYTGITAISLIILAIGVVLIRKTLTEEKRWI